MMSLCRINLPASRRRRSKRKQCKTLLRLMKVLPGHHNFFNLQMTLWRSMPGIRFSLDRSGWPLTLPNLVQFLRLFGEIQPRPSLLHLIVSQTTILTLISPDLPLTRPLTQDRDIHPPAIEFLPPPPQEYTDPPLLSSLSEENRCDQLYAAPCHFLRWLLFTCTIVNYTSASATPICWYGQLYKHSHRTSKRC